MDRPVYVLAGAGRSLWNVAIHFGYGQIIGLVFLPRSREVPKENNQNISNLRETSRPRVLVVKRAKTIYKPLFFNPEGTRRTVRHI